MKFTALLALTLFASCSSLSEKTISRMDGESKPSWATQEKALTVDNGKMHILGFTELDADAKVSAAFRMSDSQARGELSKMVENQFSSIFQNLEEGVNDEGTLSRYYASEVSKNMLRELKISKRYWEKVQAIDRDGAPTYRLRVYSLAEIPESHYKKLVREKIAQEKIDPEVKKQVLNHFESEIKQLQSN